TGNSCCDCLSLPNWAELGRNVPREWPPRPANTGERLGLLPEPTALASNACSNAYSFPDRSANENLRLIQFRIAFRVDLRCPWPWLTQNSPARFVCFSFALQLWRFQRRPNPRRARWRMRRKIFWRL